MTKISDESTRRAEILRESDRSKICKNDAEKDWKLDRDRNDVNAWTIARRHKYYRTLNRSCCRFVVFGWIFHSYFQWSEFIASIAPLNRLMNLFNNSWPCLTQRLWYCWARISFTPFDWKNICKHEKNLNCTRIKIGLKLWSFYKTNKRMFSATKHIFP